LVAVVAVFCGNAVERVDGVKIEVLWKDSCRVVSRAKLREPVVHGLAVDEIRAISRENNARSADGVPCVLVGIARVALRARDIVRLLELVDLDEFEVVCQNQLRQCAERTFEFAVVHAMYVLVLGIAVVDL